MKKVFEYINNNLGKLILSEELQELGLNDSQARGAISALYHNQYGFKVGRGIVAEKPILTKFLPSRKTSIDTVGAHKSKRKTIDYLIQNPQHVPLVSVLDAIMTIQARGSASYTIFELSELSNKSLENCRVISRELKKSKFISFNGNVGTFIKYIPITMFIQDLSVMAQKDDHDTIMEGIEIMQLDDDHTVRLTDRECREKAIHLSRTYTYASKEEKEYIAGALYKALIWHPTV